MNYRYHWFWEKPEQRPDDVDHYEAWGLCWFIPGWHRAVYSTVRKRWEHHSYAIVSCVMRWREVLK